MLSFLLNPEHNGYVWTHRFAETDYAEMSCHITKVLQGFNQAVHLCKSGNINKHISIVLF